MTTTLPSELQWCSRPASGLLGEPPVDLAARVTRVPAEFEEAGPGPQVVPALDVLPRDVGRGCVTAASGTWQSSASCWGVRSSAGGAASSRVFGTHLGAGDRSAVGADPRAARTPRGAPRLLGAAARVGEGRKVGPLTLAAGEYDRAARELWGASLRHHRPGKGCAPPQCSWHPRGSSGATRTSNSSPSSPNSPPSPTPPGSEDIARLLGRCCQPSAALPWGALVEDLLALSLGQSAPDAVGLRHRERVLAAGAKYRAGGADRFRLALQLRALRSPLPLGVEEACCAQVPAGSVFLPLPVLGYRRRYVRDLHQLHPSGGLLSHQLSGAGPGATVVGQNCTSHRADAADSTARPRRAAAARRE